MFSSRWHRVSVPHISLGDTPGPRDIGRDPDSSGGPWEYLGPEPASWEVVASPSQ